MEAVELNHVINRPTEEAFAFLAGLENVARWRREWVEAKKTSESPFGVGATFRLVSEFLGRRMGTVLGYCNRGLPLKTACSRPVQLRTISIIFLCCRS